MSERTIGIADGQYDVKEEYKDALKVWLDPAEYLLFKDGESVSADNIKYMHFFGISDSNKDLAIKLMIETMKTIKAKSINLYDYSYSSILSETDRKRRIYTCDGEQKYMPVLLALAAGYNTYLTLTYESDMVFVIEQKGVTIYHSCYHMVHKHF